MRAKLPRLWIPPMKTNFNHKAMRTALDAKASTTTARNMEGSNTMKTYEQIADELIKAAQKVKEAKGDQRQWAVSHARAVINQIEMLELL